MKIGITHFAYYPTKGGVETHLLDLCAEFISQGHEVHVLTGSLEGYGADYIFDGVNIHRRPELNLDYIREEKLKFSANLADISLFLKNNLYHLYLKFINNYNIDILHAHNFHFFIPEYALALTDLHNEGLATLLTLHNVWNDKLSRFLLQRTSWDILIAVSEYVRSETLKIVPTLSNKVYTVIHGTNTLLFRPQKVSSQLRNKYRIGSRKVILHPARMSYLKGSHVAVDAMRTVIKHHPDALLIFADTSEVIDWDQEYTEYKKKILKSISNNNLEKNIITKAIDYFDMPEIQALSDIIIYPSISEEPFGLVAIEAMSSARPIIVTNSGGLVESVIHGVTGFVVEKESPEQLAESIITLLDNTQLSINMGNNGRKHVEIQFSRKRMAIETLHLYNSAVSSAASRHDTGIALMQ